MLVNTHVEYTEHGQDEKPSEAPLLEDKKNENAIPSLSPPQQAVQF